MAPRKIVLIGPESTGKTTLTLKLASYFQSPFVLECARQYLLDSNKIQSPDDLLLLAKIQAESEAQALKNCHGPWLFCDTDIHNIVAWSRHVFNFVNPQLQKMEELQQYDLYLLLYPDLAWIADGIRENPHLRQKLHDIYRERLLEKKRSFVEIRGFENRFQSCVTRVSHYSASDLN